MKTKLSIVQIVTTLITAIFPFLNLFTYRFYAVEPDGAWDTIKETGRSMEWVFGQIGDGIHNYINWLFFITLALMIVACVIPLFKNYPIFEHKAMIGLPSVSFIIFWISVIICDNYSMDVWFNDHYGVETGATVLVNPVAYIGLVIIATTIIIECYKQFKCPKEFTSNKTDDLSNINTL